MCNHDPHKNKVKKKITHFFNKIKIIQIDTIPEINLLIIQLIIFHQIMKNALIEIINNFIQAKDLVLIILTNQIFSNHIHKTNKYNNLEIIQHFTTINFNNKIQSKHNLTNQLKSITTFHSHINYNNVK